MFERRSGKNKVQSKRQTKKNDLKGKMKGFDGKEEEERV